MASIETTETENFRSELLKLYSSHGTKGTVPQGMQAMREYIQQLDIRGKSPIQIRKLVEQKAEEVLKSSRSVRHFNQTGILSKFQ